MAPKSIDVSDSGLLGSLGSCIKNQIAVEVVRICGDVSAVTECIYEKEGFVPTDLCLFLLVT